MLVIGEPDSLQIKVENIPEELKVLKQFTLWKFENMEKEKPDKVPYWGPGTKASSSDPDTWLLFNEARDFLSNPFFDGMNVIFTDSDSYIGIDLDMCISSTGELTKNAQKIVDMCQSYTEYSPSGKGLRIFVKVSDEIRIDNRNDKISGIEIYQRNHFLSVTGNLYKPELNTIQHCDAAVLHIVENMLHPSSKEQYEMILIEDLKKYSSSENVYEILTRMFNSKYGENYKYLFEVGYLNDDQSTDDWVLACELVYQCRGDLDKAKGLIQQSAIYNIRAQEKWETDRRGYGTYTDLTLYNALCKKKSAIDKVLQKKSNEVNNVEVQSQHIKPYGYVSKGGALYKVTERVVRGTGDIQPVEVMICRQTPIIIRSFINLEQPQLFHEISWTDNGKTYSEVVPAGDLAIKKELLKLSYKSLAVTDNNAKDLIDYFDKLMVNQNNRDYLVERLGHVKTKFIHPLRENGIKILPSDLGEKQVLEAFKISGDVESWKVNVLELIKPHPTALLMLLASFASVIIKDIKLQPFIVDLSGPTSRGKTSVLRVCVSVWGDENLVSEWSLTRVSAERKASFLNSFPLCLDDSRKANPKELQNFVYNFSGGKSRGRGSVNGSQLEKTWSNIMISTGEAALTEYAESAAGVAARVLSLTKIPFENVNHEFFSRLYKGVENNHGVIGLAFVEKWYPDKDKLLPLFDQYNELFQAKAHGNEVVSRIARYYAAIVFTGDLLNNFFNCGIDLDLLHRLFDELMEENKAIDKPKQLLEIILQELDADRNSIYYEFEPSKETKAIYKNGMLYLLLKFTKDMLKVEEKSIRSEWLRRLMTLTYTNNNKTVDYTKLSHKGGSFRVIAINPDIVSGLGFDFKETNHK